MKSWSNDIIFWFLTIFYGHLDITNSKWIFRCDLFFFLSICDIWFRWILRFSEIIEFTGGGSCRESSSISACLFASISMGCDLKSSIGFSSWKWSLGGSNIRRGWCSCSAQWTVKSRLPGFHYKSYVLVCTVLHHE